MLLFGFWAPDGQQKAGCIERMVIEGPFMAQNGVNPQTRQPNYIPDVSAAAKWAASQDVGVPLPGVPFSGACIGRSLVPTQTAKVICVQATQVAVDPAYVNSGQPWGPPVGNGGGVAPPPRLQPQQAPRAVSDYEPLDASALPRSQEGIMDADPEGGTYADLDVQTGQEIVRDEKAILRTYDPSKVQRR